MSPKTPPTAARRSTVGPSTATRSIPSRSEPTRQGGSVGRHPGYAVSQQVRKWIEKGFGWIKEMALQRRARHRGKARIGWQFALAAAYNPIRLPRLLQVT